MGLVSKELPKIGTLSREQADESLKVARSKGLPNDWIITWNYKHKRKNWKSPEGKVYGNLSKALIAAKKQKTGGRELSREDVGRAMKRAKERGLADGWSVVWSVQRNRRIWISPDGTKTVDCLSKALAVANVLQSKSLNKYLASSPSDENTTLLPKKPTASSSASHRVLTDEEIEESLEEAKMRGLPERFEVFWNNDLRRRNWREPGPNGKTYKSLGRAIEVLEFKQRKLRIVSNEKRKNEDREKPASQETKDTSATTTRTGRTVKPMRLSLPSPDKTSSLAQRHRSINSLSKSNENSQRAQLNEALQYARRRGLPECWEVRYDSRRRRKQWYYGSTSCESIQRALEISEKLGLMASDESKTVPSKDVSEALDQSGLPVGWDIVFDHGAQERKYISPDGRICHTLAQALAITVHMTSGRYRRMLSKEVSVALKEAKGLSERWTLTWDTSRNDIRWISPDGKLVESLEAAAQADLELISDCGQVGKKRSFNDGFWI